MARAVHACARASGALPGVVAATALVMLATTATAHEFRIEPVDYTPPLGAALVAELVVGEHFTGDRLAREPERYTRFTLSAPDGERESRGEAGMLPAVREALAEVGLHVLAVETRPHPTVHADFAAFEDFVTEEGSPAIAARHRREGWPERNIVELYTRHAKTLVAVGGVGGRDRPLGLELELVALADPYSEVDDMLPFRLLLDGEGVADAQISVFHRVDGTAAASPAARATVRTDASGDFIIDASRAGEYLLNAVVLRRPSAARMLASGALWESLWASLTFARER